MYIEVHDAPCFMMCMLQRLVFTWHSVTRAGFLFHAISEVIIDRGQ
jgi:hypothetical protein